MPPWSLSAAPSQDGQLTRRWLAWIEQAEPRSIECHHKLSVLQLPSAREVGWVADQDTDESPCGISGAVQKEPQTS